MQVLFEHGDEHGRHTAGVGEWPGTVERLQAEMVPHMGWNVVQPGEGSRLFSGIDPATRFYFVHSYAARSWEMDSRSGPLAPPVVSWAEHGGDRFVAAVENGPLSATQFHPEKSGDAGAALLTNWLATV
jgi:glutamine amidotransferase